MDQVARLLKRFGMTKFYTDKLKTYERHLAKDEREVSKYKMQKIEQAQGNGVNHFTLTFERKHLTLRTRVKRLQRKTLCFSKVAPMHDLGIGLYINKYEFDREIE